MLEIKDCKVSIIIPVYNVEKYLAQCLDSAVSQTHQNKEIIIINDGSTDGSTAIIAEYQKIHNEIKAITTENRGLSCARNTGIKHATGQYIIFLDSDDWIDKETLEKCLKSLKTHNADIAFFNATAFADGIPDSESKKFNYIRSQNVINQKIKCRKLFEEFISSKNYIVSACLYLYRLSSFSEARFLPSITHEDNLFTTQLLINNASATAICLPDCFFHRRVRPDSIMTQQKSMKHVEGYFSVAEELLKHEIRSTNYPTAKALNIFIQIIISSALITAHAAFQRKIPFHIRKKSLRILFKINPNYINPKVALACVFPEVIVIKRWLCSLLRRA